MKKIAILFCLALVGCSNESNNLSKDYKGLVVVNKDPSGYLKACVGLKNEKDKVTNVFVTDLDYNKYNLGDTIK